MNLHKYGGEKDLDRSSNSSSNSNSNGKGDNGGESVHINEEGYEEDVLRFKLGFSSYVDNGLTVQSPYEEYPNCTTVSIYIPE